ncbi:MAG: hypothetical protein QME45_04375 [Clostridiales bacterium]|nr:hypothetical protein [Clostridiales bacterium]
MSKKSIIITILIAFFTFIAGYFVGDASAIRRVNKAIDSVSGKVQDTEDKPASTPSELSKEVKTYNIGDIININNQYTVTINKAFLTKDRNEFSDQKASKVAVIEYTYKNLNCDKGIGIFDTDFKVYDEKGNVLETYPAGAEKNPQQIAKGKQCTAEMAYGFNEGNKLELDFYDNIFSGNSSAKIIVDVK